MRRGKQGKGSWGDPRVVSLDRLEELIKTFPGLQIKDICPLMGCRLAYAQEMVEKLIADRRIERRVNAAGVEGLYLVGCRRKPRPYKRQWNDCRVYQVPNGASCAPDIALLDEWRVDRSAEVS